MTNPVVVKRKLATLQEYVDKLSAYSQRSFEQFLKNEEFRFAVERCLQVSIECAVDSAALLLASLGLRPSTRGQAAFTTLGELQVFDLEFASRLAGYVHARNLLVHQYEKLRPAWVYATMKIAVRDLSEYRRQVVVFLDQQESKQKKKGKQR